MIHGIDYLRLTFFVASKSECERWLACAFKPLFPSFAFSDPVKRSRWVAASDALDGNVSVMMPSKGDYVLCELKGNACRGLGNDGIKALLTALPPHERFQSSRMDYAWSDVGFDFKALVDWFRSDVFCTSCKSRGATIVENSDRSYGEGNTFYFPQIAKRSEACRFLRAYDKNGPLKMELEMTGDISSNLIREFMVRDTKYWSNLALGQLVKLLDFRPASERGQDTADSFLSALRVGSSSSILLRSWLSISDMQNLRIDRNSCLFSRLSGGMADCLGLATSFLERKSFSSSCSVVRTVPTGSRYTSQCSRSLVNQMLLFDEGSRISGFRS